MQAASPTSVNTAGSPAGPTPPTQLARELGVVLGYLLHRTNKAATALVDDLDLSFTQIKALHRLADTDERSLKDLAHELGLSLPATSRAVEGLHKRSMVLRLEDPDDRRMRRVQIAPAGLDVVRRMIDIRLVGLEGFASTLPAEHRTALSQALAPLLQREEIRSCVSTHQTPPTPDAQEGHR